MGRYLIDTNTLSRYFLEDFSQEGMTFLDGVVDKVPNISVITVIELLSWIRPEIEVQVRDFVEDANVIDLDIAVVRKCVQIRRSKKMKVPDAIIAATALVNGMTLITGDGDFDRIADLQVFSPDKDNPA